MSCIVDVKGKAMFYLVKCPNEKELFTPFSSSLHAGNLKKTNKQTKKLALLLLQYGKLGQKFH